uniref:Ent-kaurene oxidase n=1 Tax=Pyricularia oryzae (strain P131) TaxID=1143193 RepID=L7JH53_PYRO1
MKLRVSQSPTPQMVITMLHGTFKVDADMCEIPKLFCTKGTSKYDNSSSTYSLLASKKRNSNVVGQYIKNGIPFRMRNPADPSQPQVILPFKYLSEMKNAAESSWSFMHFSNQSFLLEYINAPLGSSIAHQVVRGELNKNLDWTALQPYMLFANTIARTTSLVLAGPELSANPEWTTIMVTFTMTLMQTSQEVRAKYSPWLRWLVPWIHPGAKNLYKIRKRCAQLLAPSYQNRRAGMVGDEKPFMDAIQWLMNKRTYKSKDLMKLSDDQLFLSVASIHSTSASTLSTLYDLLDRPECMDGILHEIRTIRAESKSSDWTKHDLDRLVKLDSFMKESQRYHPVGQVTVQRSNPRAYEFSDGLKIPANTQTCFLSYELNHDPDVYPDPETFDADRFLRMREKVDLQKYHFAYVSEDSINFGAGAHSCPGRHFAANEIKLMLCELLLGYEMKWPDGQSRPPTMFHDFSSNPNPGFDICIRERRL